MDHFFTSKTIAHLMDVLSSIKQARGVANADFIHDSTELEIMDQNTRTSAQYESLLQLTSSRNALRALLDMSDRKIESLRKYTSYFLGKGMKSLPDEVLSHVFEISYGENCYNTGGYRWDRVWQLRDSRCFSVAVSSVSRRFRRVALDSPRIWCHLDNIMNPDLLALFISRSRGALLHLHVAGGNRKTSMDHFLELAATEAPRWATFSVDARFLTTGEETTIHQCRDLLLPRLTKLVHIIDYTTVPKDMEV
ncbi:hypothetical protein BD410DRAFT_361047 [Rickenella mellea]|uniref:Uncharacterized protein n=1 Tax=Rickenella mellea TaxID=50990 RepID=A0A4Y7PEN0_9AGAM|nr:hypothetical protein BD410DRAFT_361047 [Rickenella mellea]